MDDQPMSNTPIETETAEQEATRLAQFKQQVRARAEELTGLTFDSETGHCTTPGTVKMEGELKVRWAALVTQIGKERDPQKGEQLLRDAGKMLREAIQSEPGTIDEEARQSE